MYSLTFMNWSNAFDAKELPLNNVRVSPVSVCVVRYRKMKQPEQFQYGISRT